MFVYASTIVAILTRRADADELVNALDAARSPISSAIAAFEATFGICRKRHASVAEAQENISEFLATAGVRTVSITSKEAEAALDAFSRSGKGRVHPAQLNMGGCFAYAIVKTHGIGVLFKGDVYQIDIPHGTQARELQPTQPEKAAKSGPITNEAAYRVDVL